MRFRPWLVMGLCAFALAALGGASASSCTGSCALPPPSFRPASGWVVLKPGRSEPNLSAGMVVAVTARDAAALQPFAPFSFKRLRPQGILVWATTMGRGPGGPTSNFPRARWPLRLSTFRLDRGWEGQPAPNIQQRLRWATIRGWHLDVRVYFATQRPNKRLVAEAQAQLNRLLLPSTH